VLAILVMVTAFAAITVFSVTMLVIQSAARSDAAHKRMKCYYAARAGLADAAYLCRQQRHWQSGVTLPEKTYIEDKVFFYLQQRQADSFLLDTRFSATGRSHANRNSINGIMFYNAVASLPVKITGLNLTWTKGGRLRKIVIGGKNVWKGRLRSPASCNIKPVSLLSSGVSIDSLQFDADMRGGELNAAFLFSDGSTTQRTLYPASDKVLLNLRVEGGIEGSPVSCLCSAEYDFVSGSLSAAQEATDAL